MILNMDRVMKVVVLAMFLSVASAWQPWEFHWATLSDLHTYNYTSTDYKIHPINTDKTTELRLYKDKTMKGRLRLMDDKLDRRYDDNCFGGWGLKDPSIPETYCFKSIDFVFEYKLKMAWVELSFLGPHDHKNFRVKVPLFKDSTDPVIDKPFSDLKPYEEWIQRAEPITFEQIRSLRSGRRRIDFSLAWLKNTLSEPVFEYPDILTRVTFITYPMVMPPAKFEYLMAYVQSTDQLI